MCIIITKEKNAKPLPRKIFETIWENNPNGAGILFNDGKSTTLTKGIMDKKDFLEKTKQANRKECSFIIHCRIATHGSVKPENTHPFTSKTLGFAHNGTMNITPFPDATDSETFFRKALENKDLQWCKDNLFLLDLAIKSQHSRCAVFDMNTGEILHLNKEDWVEDEKYAGYLFSNTSYEYERKTTYYSGSGTSWNYTSGKGWSNTNIDELDDDDEDWYMYNGYSYRDEKALEIEQDKILEEYNKNRMKEIKEQLKYQAIGKDLRFNYNLVKETLGENCKKCDSDKDKENFLKYKDMLGQELDLVESNYEEYDSERIIAKQVYGFFAISNLLKYHKIKEVMGALKCFVYNYLPKIEDVTNILEKDYLTKLNKYITNINEEVEKKENRKNKKQK